MGPYPRSFDGPNAVADIGLLRGLISYCASTPPVETRRVRMIKVLNDQYFRALPANASLLRVDFNARRLRMHSVQRSSSDSVRRFRSQSVESGRIGRLIDGATRRQPDREAICVLFEECRLIASAYLSQKVRLRRLEVEFFGLSVNDLAIDCIADLFARDEGGALQQFQAYFALIDWHQLASAELEVALRRLVFSSVNQSLFRRYGEADPTLSRIIRSVKRHLRHRDDLRLTSRSTEQWIVLNNQREAAMPIAPPALLEAQLVPCQGDITTSLDALRNFLSERTWYAAGYSLSVFARLLRSASIRLTVAEQVDYGFDESLDGAAVTRVIDVAVRKIEEEKRPHYVGKGKVSSEVYTAYIESVRIALVTEFVGGRHGSLSLFKTLSRSLPGLAGSSYQRRHRHSVEYLAKLSRRETIKILRADLGIAIAS
jgi:hypothetical protein